MISSDLLKLSTAIKTGTMSAAQFSKLAGLPASALALAWGNGFIDFKNGVADSSVLATASVDGTLSADDFKKLATLQNGASIAGCYASALVDFATAATGIVFIPAAPGFYANVISVATLMTAGSGTLTVAHLLKAGNNVARDNVIAQQTTSTWSASAQGRLVSIGVPLRGPLGAAFTATAGAPFPSGPLLNLSAPVLLDITTPSSGTGGFTLVGRVLSMYQLIPV